MTTPRLFLLTALAENSEVILEGDTFNRIVRVLRMSVGEPLTLFDGSGGEYPAVIESVSKRSAVLRTAGKIDRSVESPLNITLVQSVSKGDRMEFTLQKAVELGVSAIRPIFSERSVVRLKGERLEKKMGHWQGIIRHACEQSGRNRVPELLAPLDFMDFLSECRTPAYILDPLAESGLASLPSTEPFTLLIGPEGGFSSGEIHAANKSGIKGVKLGPRILRTETAGIAALAALQVLWGDLGG